MYSTVRRSPRKFCPALFPVQNSSRSVYSTQGIPFGGCHALSSNSVDSILHSVWCFLVFLNWFFASEYDLYHRLGHIKLESCRRMPPVNFVSFEDLLFFYEDCYGFNMHPRMLRVQVRGSLTTDTRQVQRYAKSFRTAFDMFTYHERQVCICLDSKRDSILAHSSSFELPSS